MTFSDVWKFGLRAFLVEFILISISILILCLIKNKEMRVLYLKALGLFLSVLTVFGCIFSAGIFFHRVWAFVNARPKIEITGDARLEASSINLGADLIINGNLSVGAAKDDVIISSAIEQSGKRKL